MTPLKTYSESIDRYKTEYPSHMYGDNIVGITLDLKDIKKIVFKDDVEYAFYFIIDDTYNYQFCIRVSGSKVLPIFIKYKYDIKTGKEKLMDPDESDIIREYIRDNWDVSKIESYLLKKDLSKDTKDTFGDLF